MLQSLLEHLKLSPPATKWPDVEQFEDPKEKGLIAGQTTLTGAHFPARRDIIESNSKNDGLDFSSQPEVLCEFILNHYKNSLELVLDPDQQKTLKGIANKLEQARVLKQPEHAFSELEEYRFGRKEHFTKSFGFSVFGSASIATLGVAVVAGIESAAASSGWNLILPLSNAHLVALGALSILGGIKFGQAMMQGPQDGDYLEVKKNNPDRHATRIIIDEVDKVVKANFGSKEYKNAFSAACIKVSERLTLEALNELRGLLKEAGISENMYAQAKLALSRNYMLQSREETSIRLINMVREDFNINPEYESSSSEPFDELLYAFYNKYGEEAGHDLLQGFHNAIIQNRETILTNDTSVDPSIFFNAKLNSYLVKSVFDHVINEARMFSDQEERSATLDLILYRLKRMVNLRGEIEDIPAGTFNN